MRLAKKAAYTVLSYMRFLVRALCYAAHYYAPHACGQ